jgi:hypothetical protein
VDIHGLHVDSFTRHHAKRFSELKWAAQGNNGIPYLEILSFDKLKYAENIHKALRWVTDYDVKASFLLLLALQFHRTVLMIFGNRIQIAQKIVDDVGETIYLFPHAV